MSGELDLEKLMATMSAELHEGVFVFATMKNGQMPTGVAPRMMFQENEGTTLILLKSEADAAGLSFEFPSRMITLNVHSSLEAVGFIARIATELAAAGMGVNPVSAFYHDHLFNPDGRQDEAMTLLKAMAAS
ncbi:MAG: ACT domain-containing protein [Paracoccaceae bacterium]|nr:ACT domain-containing protein [Paracoccaceae bacterium]